MAKQRRAAANRSPSQLDRVRSLLLLGRWVCGAEFLAADPPILRYAARLCELRAEGFAFGWRHCESHDHPYGKMYQWRLVEAPACWQQLVRLAKGEEQGSLFQGHTGEADGPRTVQDESDSASQPSNDPAGRNGGVVNEAAVSAHGKR